MTLNLAVCYLCGTAFTIAGVLDHLNKSHKGSYQWAISERAQVKAVLAEMGVLDQYPVRYTATQVYSHFSGLTVVDGYGCTACFKNGSTQASLMKHFKIDHPTLPKPGAFPVSLGQYINRGATQILLRIKERSIEALHSFNSLSTSSHLSYSSKSTSSQHSSDSSLASHSLHSISTSQPLISHSNPNSLSTPSPPPSVAVSSSDHSKILRDFQQTFIKLRNMRSTIPNARFISPFLLRTRWHELVSTTEDVTELRALVAKPDANDHPELLTTLQGYFRFCDSLLDQRVTNLLVLQQLNSDDPDQN